jgi:hypothetical protein
MKLCSECKQKEKSWSQSLSSSKCEESWCENYIETKISICDKNKKYDLEIEIKKTDIEILKFQKIIYNLENTRNQLLEELNK